MPVYTEEMFIREIEKTLYMVPYFNKTGETFSCVYFSFHLFSLIFAFFKKFIYFHNILFSCNLYYPSAFFYLVPFANSILYVLIIPEYVIRILISSLLIFKL